MIRRLACLSAVLAAMVFAAPAAAQATPAAGTTTPGPWRSSPGTAAEDGAAAASAQSVLYAITGAAVGGVVAYSLASGSCDGDPPSAATCLGAFVALGATLGAVYGWNVGAERSRSGTRLYLTRPF